MDTKLSRKSILSLASIAVLTGTLLFLTTYQPQIEYQPGADTPATGLRPGYYPEELVEAFLQQTESLPPAGASLHCCLPHLAWDEHEQAVSVLSEHRIAEVKIHRVQLSGWRGLLHDIVDDDPTHGARVDVTVTLRNGEDVPLVFRLWDYGLLTPWAVYPYGDGWKPSRVEWQ